MHCPPADSGRAILVSGERNLTATVVVGARPKKRAGLARAPAAAAAGGVCDPRSASRLANAAVANSLRARYVWKMSKPRRAPWRDLPKDKMAELLATPTITDLAWTEERDHEPRL